MILHCCGVCKYSNPSKLIPGKVECKELAYKIVTINNGIRDISDMFEVPESFYCDFFEEKENSKDCGGECHADCDPYPACEGNQK